MRHLSVHDALAAWQAGEIPEAEALRLTGATSRHELYAHCISCDVAIVDEIPDGEMRAIEALRREMAEG